MKHILTVFSCLLITAACAQPGLAQSTHIPADDHFYQPDIQPYRKVVSQPDASSDQSKILQEAIDEVANKGGGTLIIGAVGDKNRYTINKGVVLKSNVHIRVQPNVVFDSVRSDTVKLFSAGKTGREPIENFSFSGTDPEQFFTFDFSARKAGGKGHGAIAIAIGAARNFRVADFKVLDNFTQFSAVTVNLLKASGSTYLFARNGIFEHLELSRGHYGYGLIQVQAAANVLYRDLKSNGGVALRLESGAVHNAYLVDKSITIDEIYGENISCSDGQAAITMSPHTIKNGTVFVDKLSARSCEAGAIIAAGFLSQRKGQRDSEGNAINGHVLGSFDSKSVISNLKVTYGDNAQLRSQRRYFVPCGQRHKVNSERNPDEESFRGPTVAGVVYYAKAGDASDRGYYTVNLQGLELSDFPKVDGELENKVYVTSEKDYVKNCELSWRNNQ